MTNQKAIPQPFRAMVAKELLHNSRWMILGFIATSAALVISLTNTLQTNLPSFTAIQPLYPFCTVLVGLLLGGVSLLGENRGDGYGFLVHRPMARHEIFAAKATAGLLLYFGAVGVPLLLAAAWVAWPGHLPAPFDLLLLRGPFVNLLCGVVGYFVGFLGTMREARWYATRWLAPFGAFLLVMYVQATATFLVAVGCCVAVVVIAALAARGAFISGGGYERQPLVSRMATTLALAASLYMAGMIIQPYIVWAGSLIQGRSEKPQISTSDTPTQKLELLPSGPVRVVRKHGGSVVSVTDLDGKDIPVPTFMRLVDSVRSTSLSFEPPLGRFAGMGYRNSESIYRNLGIVNDQEGVLWYLVRRTGLVVGYDKKTKLVVAYAGPDGFTEPGVKPPKGFSGTLLREGPMTFPDNNGGPSSHGVVIAFDSAVYTLSPAEHVVEMAFSATSGETVLDATNSRDGWLLVSTTKAIYLRPPFGAASTIIPIPPQISKDRGVILEWPLAPHPDAFYVTFLPGDITPSLQGDSLVTPARQMVKFSPGGTPVDSYPLPGSSILHHRTFEPVAEIATALTRPAVLNFVRPGSTTVQNPFAPEHSGWFFPLVALLALLSSVIMVVMAWRHSFPTSRLALWAAIGLVMGPLGIALMASTVDWPTSEPCPNCKRRRVITHTLCEHCGQPYPPPVPDGTEILDPVFASAA